MGISGSGLKDKNVQLRLFIYVFMGIMAISSVVYWKGQLIANSEYADLSVVHNKKSKDPSTLKSHNFQIETMDVSPTVK